MGGNLHHEGDEFRVNDFRGTVGSSDLEGNVGVIMGKKRPKLTAALTSTRLDIADLGPDAWKPSRGQGRPERAREACRRRSRVRVPGRVAAS